MTQVKLSFQSLIVRTAAAVAAAGCAAALAGVLAVGSADVEVRADGATGGTTAPVVPGTTVNPGGGQSPTEWNSKG